MARIVSKRQAAMIRAGRVWGVYSAYDGYLRVRGEVVSVHATERLAQGALRRHARGMYGIAHLGDRLETDDLILRDA